MPKRRAEFYEAADAVNATIRKIVGLIDKLCRMMSVLG